jgi:hypothetical protein
MRNAEYGTAVIRKLVYVSLLAAAICGERALPATVTGLVQNVTGQATGTATVRFIPLSTPLPNGGGNVVMDVPKRVSVGTNADGTLNGAFSVTNLVGGLYDTDFGLTSGRYIRIVVPLNDTNTYSFVSLANLLMNWTLWGYTNTAGQWVTAGTNVTMVTNGLGVVTVSASPGSGGASNPNALTNNETRLANFATGVEAGGGVIALRSDGTAVMNGLLTVGAISLGGENILLNADGSAHFSGAADGLSFSGDGSGLTGLTIPHIVGFTNAVLAIGTNAPFVIADSGSATNLTEYKLLNVKGLSSTHGEVKVFNVNADQFIDLDGGGGSSTPKITTPALNIVGLGPAKDAVSISTSAGIASAISDETGAGPLVFANGPSLLLTNQFLWGDVSASGVFQGSGSGLTNAGPGLATNSTSASDGWALTKTGDRLKLVNVTGLGDVTQVGQNNFTGSNHFTVLEASGNIRADGNLRGSTLTVDNSATVGGNLDVSVGLTAATLAGNGAGLTALPASQLTGVVPQAAIPTNITLYSGAGGTVTVKRATTGASILSIDNDTGNVRTWNNLNSLNGDGTFYFASGSISGDATGIAAPNFFGGGASLTSLNGSQVTTGTVGDARLSGNVGFLNGTNTWSGTNSFTNANNVFAGTLTNKASAGSKLQLTDANGKIVDGTVGSGLSLSAGTLSATAGGPWSSSPATATEDAGGFALTNVANVILSSPAAVGSAVPIAFTNIGVSIGSNNFFSGTAAQQTGFIAGGSNLVTGPFGVALGQEAIAGQNSFCWSDGSSVGIINSGYAQFIGGIIITESAKTPGKGGLAVGGGIVSAPGGGTIVATNKLGIGTGAVQASNTVEISSARLAQSFQIDTNGNTYIKGLLNVTGATTLGTVNANGSGVTNLVRSFGITVDGGGSALSTGLKGYVSVPFDCAILSATMLADQSGSAVVDVWRCTYSQFDAGSTHPVSGDKITASAPPTITSTYKSQDATLTGWTTTLSANDVLAFNVNSASTITKLTLVLKVVTR